MLLSCHSGNACCNLPLIRIVSSLEGSASGYRLNKAKLLRFGAVKLLCGKSLLQCIGALTDTLKMFVVYIVDNFSLMCSPPV